METINIEVDAETMANEWQYDHNRVMLEGEREATQAQKDYIAILELKYPKEADELNCIIRYYTPERGIKNPYFGQASFVISRLNSILRRNRAHVNKGLIEQVSKKTGIKKKYLHFLHVHTLKEMLEEI